MSKKMIRVLLTVAVLGGAFVTLLATTMRENVQYYMDVNEVMPVATQWYGKSLQLRGFVVDGSIRRIPNTLDYQFKVKNGDAVVTANYTGVLPDTFKDGAEVVLKGRLDSTSFKVEPNGVIAKCPSKYQAKDGPAS